MDSAIYRFLTQEGGKPRTFGLVVDRRHQAAALAISELAELAELANDHPGSCAFGKIAVLAVEGIFTFQAGHEKASCPVFCGNSTAAAIACLNDGGELRSALHGMACAPYEVSARIVGDTVSQSWILPPGRVAEHRWRGRTVLLLKALNDYAVVLGDLPDGLHPEAARRELLGAGIGGKLAVVADEGDGPVVRFFNSNGRHGAVPQTGIASLALGARASGRLRSCFPDGELSYILDGETCRSRLPEVAEAPCGKVEVRMPDIDVTLSPLLRDLAA